MTPTRLTFAMLATAALAFQQPDSPGKSERLDAAKILQDLVGKYIHSNGFVGESLELRPGGRFSYEWFSDHGGPHREEGTVEVVNGLVTLHPEKFESNQKPGGLIKHPTLRPIRWGRRYYLLVEADLLKFCNSVNLGFEPRKELIGPFYARKRMTERKNVGEEEPSLETAEGLPVLPKEWEPFLLKKPVAGKIVETLDANRARIDLGTEDGLRMGMKLMVEGERSDTGSRVAIVEIREVEARRCLVETKQVPIFEITLKVGQKVFSRIPKKILEEDILFFLR